MGLLDLIAGPLIGGAAQLLGGSAANKASAEAAQKQMDFQREMSSTQYQRTVEDMKKAGLNPMLMAGLDSSAAGASYQAQNPAAGFGQLGAAVSSNALQSKLIDSQIQLNLTGSDKATADAALAKVTGELKEIEKRLTVENIKATGAGAKKLSAEAIQEQAKAEWIKDHPALWGMIQGLHPIMGALGGIVGSAAGVKYLMGGK